jgi:class 3 adenylate cyclase
VIAERFDKASVLFADVVGFTPISAGLAPEQVVELLNEVFSDFDVLADKHGVEKIKTIGDSYMAAAGVPTPRPDHARAIADLAIDIQSYCQAHPMLAGSPLRFRIGINSGPLIAGVIGRRKFIYDLWGDSVNTASRMESHGEPGMIHLTEAAYLELKDEYVCEPRGLVDVKGKGPMPTWFLVGRRSVG